MEARINFPPSSDKIWKQIDTDLETIIPKVFTQKTINKLSTSELSHKFDTWLHGYFLEQFGQKQNEQLEKTHSAKKAKQRIRTPGPQEKTM